MFNANSSKRLLNQFQESLGSYDDRLIRKISSYEHDSFSFMKANVKVNVYDDHIEVVKHKKDFLVPFNLNEQDRENALNMYGLVLLEKEKSDICKDRLFVLSDTNELVLNRDNISLLNALDRSRDNIKKSRIRTLNNLYSYSLSNNWNYWLTLTFDQTIFDSSDVDVVNHNYNLFSKEIKRIDPKANLLFVLEYHSDHEHIHLHGFIHSSVNCLDEYLSLAINPHDGSMIKDHCGNIVYNCSLWKCGFATVVKIPFNANKQRIANYLTKYIGKDLCMPYGAKMLLHSRGLKSRFEYCAMLSENELQSLISEYYFEIGHPEYFNFDYTKMSIFKKETSSVIVFNLTYNTDSGGS